MTDAFDRTPMRQHPHRWRLSRAGFVNVWHYLENTFDISGGRLILRGTNGSGKSRALEMLLPFLLDADRRNMGTGSSVRMEDLMSAGAGEQNNRLGYMWLELRCDPDPAEVDNPDPQYLTLGALVRFAVSTKEAKVWYFTTPLRVGNELPLLGADRQPMSRRDLGEVITEERITDIPERHRERVRAEVFGLTGHLGRERFDGLAKLLHTLRSPDVGNRIEEGRLPAILADALPPLSEDALTDAGQQLDGLTSTREDQQRLETARNHIRTFLDAYRKYVTGVLASSLQYVRAGAASVSDAAKEATRLAARATDLGADLTANRLLAVELDEQIEQLDAILQGLRESDAYRSREDLHQLEAVVRSEATTADTVLKAAGTLRREETAAAASAAERADTAERAAEKVSEEIHRTRDLLTRIGLNQHELPVHVSVDRRPGPRTTDIVQVSRDTEPEIVERPVGEMLAVVPQDFHSLISSARRVGNAARTRAAQAANRAEDARNLATERVKVERARTAATEAENRAGEEQHIAEKAADDRDDAAIDLVDRWRSWVADPVTLDLVGFIDWSAHPVLGPVLAERTALCGDGDGPFDLDRAADDAVSAAESPLIAALVRFADADAADEKHVALLKAERSQLDKAHDPDPVPPAWVTVTEGVPLWRCLDFVEAVHPDDRAGIESALLASGLLTATVDHDGRLVAADGQLLVSVGGGGASVPLSVVLSVDPASPLPATVVNTVLDHISFADRTASTWIDRDGSWGNGPLRGRHTAPIARHIGAAARAAARAARIAEIDTELAELAEAKRIRQREREELDNRQHRLREHRRSIPTSAMLAGKRSSARTAQQQAARSTSEAARLRTSADVLARAWAEQEREHRRACAEFDLPDAEDPLRHLHRDAEAAAAGCVSVEACTGELTRAMNRHTEAIAAIGEVAGRRAVAESEAAAGWRIWHTSATRLRTLKDTVGAAVDEVTRKVNATERERSRVKEQIAATNAAVQKLSHDTGTATTEAAIAADRVSELRILLTGWVTTVIDQLSQPGIADTAFPAAPGRIFANLTPEAVDSDAEALLGLLRRGRSDENALIRAQQVFEQSISTHYDVSATVAAGVRLFELVDAEGRRPLARAAIEIDRQCQIGRTALTEREHEVFSRFVLGEVGEELRRRLGQATRLVSAMNASLKSIRTSHGIGVRLTWKLSEDTSGDVQRIKELISVAAAVRTAAQDAELTELLSARVAAEAIQDPTAGYAVHLRGALDYRAWHTVEVFITGPEPGRERRISRRAKLSQGETRFVSYVTLFATIDAYLSGLESTTTSLRLILLDDAFAKVDEPTIAELLGLLVRLDVDFVLTGHALWGCVPQVPSLDIYEICRGEGTPAATAHVRWDGRTRHFLHAA